MLVTRSRSAATSLRPNLIARLYHRAARTGSAAAAFGAKDGSYEMPRSTAASALPALAARLSQGRAAATLPSRKRRSPLSRNEAEVEGGEAAGSASAFLPEPTDSGRGGSGAL